MRIGPLPNEADRNLQLLRGEYGRAILSQKAGIGPREFVGAVFPSKEIPMAGELKLRLIGGYSLAFAMKGDEASVFIESSGKKVAFLASLARAGIGQEGCEIAWGTITSKFTLLAALGAGMDSKGKGAIFKTIGNPPSLDGREKLRAALQMEENLQKYPNSLMAVFGGLEPERKTGAMIAELRSNAAPLGRAGAFGNVFSQAQSQNAQVVLFGENHEVEAHREGLAEAISALDLKSQGYAALGLEHFPEREQKNIDGRKYGALEKFLEKYWGYDSKTTESIIGLIKECHKNGIRVLALDIDSEYPPKEKSADGDGPDNSALREANMAKVVSGQLSGGGKAVMLAGNAHIRGIAAALGHEKSLVVGLAGGVDRLNKRDNLEYSIAKAGFGESWLALKVKDMPSLGMGGAGADMVLHAPQAEPMSDLSMASENMMLIMSLDILGYDKKTAMGGR